MKKLKKCSSKDNIVATGATAEQSPELGLNLKQDLKTALNNPHLSDVVFTCADGVTMYASRLTLATRSEMLRNMLCGCWREASSNEVSLSEISSIQFTVVLEFCYLEETPSLSLDNALEVFKAADFFILPHLQGIVVEYVKDNLDDYILAGKMLSKAVESLELNNDHILFKFLRKFFLSKNLVEGQLVSLSREALEVLLADIDAMKNCPTSAFDLFKCVIDWGFEMVGRTEANEDRQKLLAYLNNSHNLGKEKGKSPDHNVSWRSIDEIGKVVMPIVRKIHFEAMCPHQLAVIVDTLTFIPSDILCAAFRGHVSSYTTTMICDAVWSLGENPDSSSVELSANGKIAQNLNSYDYNEQVFAHSLPNYGITEWNIVVEDVGRYPKHTSVGLSRNAVKCNNFGVYTNTWGITSTGQNHALGSETHHSIPYSYGDILTFRADMIERACTILVNGTDSGIIWQNLPSSIYPAATISRGGGLELKSCIWSKGVV